MENSHKILLLDDDPDLLAMYREILAQLPSQPSIFTATSGARAMAMLESEQFRLLISDLKIVRGRLGSGASVSKLPARQERIL